MEFLIIALLILLNGIFSMSEIALISVRKYKLEHAKQKGNTNAKIALDLANNPDTFLSTVQIGITLIGILVGIFSDNEVKAGLAERLAQIEILSSAAESIAVAIVVAIVTFASLIFGELLPKRIGMMFPEPIAYVMARPMLVISRISKPFVWILTQTNAAILRLVGISGHKKSKATEEEIKALIEESTVDGEIQEIEQDIVERVFALGDRRISELMTHRSDLIWLDITDPLSVVKQKAAKEMHSTYPVAEGNIDNIVGILSLKDLFPKALKEETFNLKDHMRKPLILHENIPAYHVLERFRETRWHYAIVVDEYGSVQGMVSMDDILDALVGDVSEYGQNDYTITQRDDFSWFADAQYPYFELLNYFDLDDDADEEEETGGFNTIAGLVLSNLDRIPVIGDKVSWRNFEIEVVDMDGMRIDKVIITKHIAEETLS